jgi:hypothetical protein
MCRVTLIVRLEIVPSAVWGSDGDGLITARKMKDENQTS